jgi:hypothetical protein
MTDETPIGAPLDERSCGCFVPFWLSFRYRSALFRQFESVIYSTPAIESVGVYSNY